MFNVSIREYFSVLNAFIVCIRNTAVFKLIPLLRTHVYSYMFSTVHPPSRRYNMRAIINVSMRSLYRSLHTRVIGLPMVRNWLFMQALYFKERELSYMSTVLLIHITWHPIGLFSNNGGVDPYFHTSVSSGDQKFSLCFPIHLKWSPTYWFGVFKGNFGVNST